MTTEREIKWTFLSKEDACKEANIQISVQKVLLKFKNERISVDIFLVENLKQTKVFLSPTL